MALYLGVHKIPQGMEDNQVREGFLGYRKNAMNQGLNAKMAVYSLARGFAYCLTEASSPDQIQAAHKKAAVPLEDVIEVKEIT